MKKHIIKVFLLVLGIILLGTFSNSVRAAENIKSKMYLDSPTTNQTVVNDNTLTIKGWVMVNQRNTNIKIYLDGKQISNELVHRQTRPDVLKAIKGYGTNIENPLPGFEANIDITQIRDGKKHNIKIEILSNKGIVIFEKTKQVVFAEFSSRMYLDSPRGEIIKNNLKIRGWKLSDDTQAKIKISLDGKEQSGLKINPEKRPDVLSLIPGYGGAKLNPIPGFNANIDTSNLPDGKHTLKIEIISGKGKVMTSVTRVITIKKYDARMYIDSPRSETIKTTLKFRGWKLSEDTQAKIRISIDGKELTGLKINSEKRPDVLQLIPGYGGARLNPVPGFNANIDTSNLNDGNHTLKTEIISRKGEVIASDTRTITVKKYEARMYIDSPRSETIKTNLKIRGWRLSEDTQAKIRVSIDGKEQTGLKIESEKRPDVLKLIPGYGGAKLNPIPGFNINIDTSKLLDGKHILKTEIVSRKGEIIASDTRTITVKKYTARMYIDSPRNETIKTNLKIRGWRLSEDTQAKIRVSIDGKEQTGLKVESEKRPDVLKLIPGYGGANLNPTPGFNVNVNTSKLSDGKHTLKIEVISRIGEVLATDTRTITIKKYDAKIYIDKPVVDQVVRGDNLIIKGWEMSEQLNSKVYIYVDNKKVPDIVRQERPDVLAAIKDYGGTNTNVKPGFYVQANVANLKEGIHTVKVEVWSDRNEHMSTITKTFRINREYLLGIDVSEHNGNVDWQKVKDSGINFAIIRCGYGQNATSQDDKKFTKNISECERLGIPYGVYIYSYAANRNGAKSEAEHVIRLLNGRNPSFGVWIDMEDTDGYKQKNNIPYTMAPEICDEFCSYMKKKGYKAGIYANIEWFKNYLTASYLEQYPKWVAQWNSKCDYEGKYIMWQYTSSGKVEGISGNVDMNKWYKY